MKKPTPTAGAIGAVVVALLLLASRFAAQTNPEPHRPADEPSKSEAAPARDAELVALLEERATLRAFDGAPPVIPHAVGERGRDDCLTCHASGRAFSNFAKPAPIPPHSLELRNCRQCHVMRGSPPPEPWRQNSFEGLAAPGRGHRQNPMAPPMMPHHPQLRDNCLACHGEKGWLAIESPHPWRANCTQCHAQPARLSGVPAEK